MSLSIENFGDFHRAVHGSAPFAWQLRLLRQIMNERAWPRVLDLPTGAGKTTCIDIALFALALDAQSPAAERFCARRIAMIVDRRVVVDQAAERGRKLLSALSDGAAQPVVREVATRLRSLCPMREEGEAPIGVYTLRGGVPKDDGWARTPDLPLILASTVDQIGSRLLLQGYGVSQGMRPVHAGLLGNDVLLLLDEVHLSQPFAETLDRLQGLRSRFVGRLGVPARFFHVFLSATPRSSDHAVFHLEEEERGADSPLGPRLHAPKPCVLREVDDRTGVERECVSQAREFIAAHDVIAVVVNRVASAMAISRQLREVLGPASQVDVHLLTGRMRPLDRDDLLRRLRPRIMTGRDRGGVDRKLIVVGTQCIEAGADFDFDALVTEAASLDALRQRFGRVDRLGLYRRAEGVIIRDKGTKDDPVYGATIGRTAAWLKERLTRKTKSIDFGVLGLPVPDERDRAEMVAPAQRAPALLPAYLDLWMQTAPAPAAQPEVSLWLHGPRKSPADVQVVWRADLAEEDLKDPERAAAIVASVRPSSLEAMSLPYAVVRRWLGGEGTEDMVDVEVSLSEESDEREGARAGCRALRWSGDESEVIGASELRPGDTLIVPAARGGIQDGCFDPSQRGSAEEVRDLAERAALLGRGVPVLRTHEAVLKQLDIALPVDDMEEARAVLRQLAAREPVPWRRLWLDALADGKEIVVEGEEAWIVLQGRRVRPERLRALMQSEDTLEDGVELTTDEDDSFHAGRSVSLAEHSGDVESFARAFASAIGLPVNRVEDIACAGWLHDIGKADRRFQLMLRGGSEIEYMKDPTPWAKSSMPPGARAAHRLAQRRSGYPRGARHEVQSVAMLERHRERLEGRDIDLVLHLVASHHGQCRPFAPVVDDEEPVEVALLGHGSERFGTIDFGAISSRNELHRLDAPMADRFWGLVEKYGWLELCWLEAILRLADHRASEKEQQTGGTK